MNQPKIKLLNTYINKTESFARYFFQLEGNKDVFCITIGFNASYGLLDCDMALRTIKTHSNGERYVSLENTNQNRDTCLEYLYELHNQAQSSQNIYDYNDVKISLDELNEFYNNLIQFK